MASGIYKLPPTRDESSDSRNGLSRFSIRWKREIPGCWTEFSVVSASHSCQHGAKKVSRLTDESNEGKSCRSIFVSTRFFSPPIIPLSRWKNIFPINFLSPLPENIYYERIVNRIGVVFKKSEILRIETISYTYNSIFFSFLLLKRIFARILFIVENKIPRSLCI